MDPRGGRPDAGRDGTADPSILNDEIVVTRAQLSRLLAHVDVGIVAVTLDGRISFASPSIATLAGYDPQTLVGRSMVEMVHPDDFALASRLLDTWGPRPGAAPIEPIRVKVASGEWVAMDVDGISGPDVAPFGGAVVTLRPVEGQSESERELRGRLVDEGRLVRLASAFVNLPADRLDDGVNTALEEMGGLAGVDRIEVVLFDPASNDMINTHEWVAPGVEPLRQRVGRLATPDIPMLRALRRHEEVNLPSVATLGEAWQAEREWFENRMVRSAMAVPLSDQGKLIGFLGFEAVRREWTFDVGHTNTLRSAAGILGQAFARSAVEAQLDYQSRHDPLTDLPNRWAFLEATRRAVDHLARSPRPRRGLAVLLFDLDRFKVINDSLGHRVGDELLIAIAGRLARACPPGAELARMGGDELVVLVDDVVSEAAAVAVARDLHRVIHEPVTVEGHEVATTASVGVAFTSDPGEEADDLLRHADAAMYAAKELGGNRVEVFDDTLRADVRRRLQDEIELRQAIERGELEVFYQPEIEVPSGRLIGAEALVRWQHPTRGLLAAVEFIDLAEETGLILELGVWVLREACRRQVDWQQRHPGRPLVMRVNLSARQVGQPDLLPHVVEILRETGIQPANLCLEITETTVMADAAASLEVLEKLRGLGVELAIDDFGTGYSSLSYLKRFPVDVLKVDRSFVDGLGSDPDDTAIVQAIMVLANTLGLRVTAEGVETERQMRELLRLGCTRVQGYLFARPEAAPDFERHLGGPPLRPWLPGGA
jgi:diguanylate cyclase (GGDEF)-like protein/PAS domain S-box-containing protein